MYENNGVQIFQALDPLLFWAHMRSGAHSFCNDPSPSAIQT